ncbi:MAG: tyrosine-type recombinase/integrase [Gammaproteobacteria bacterium]|nr:tyrosine-type recombinase/integrase [Gammaproteobacteria bacterium]MDH5651325.1 tyrosine-type recombinase/integrase [Gammaproteobacteria bacterium]
MLERLTFTDRYLKSLKAEQDKYFKIEYSPHKRNGRLSVFVERSGRKTFKFQYYSNGKRRFVIIGEYKEKSNGPGISLVEARQQFAELSKQYQELLQKGIDLRTYIQEQNRIEKREIKEREQRGTFGQLLDHYIADMRSRGCRTTDRIDRWFTDYVRNHYPLMLKQPANEITPNDIASILRRIHKEGIGKKKSKYRPNHKTGATTQVNKIRRNLYTAFQVGIKKENDPRDLLGCDIRFGLKSNPVSGVPVVSEWERTGERALEFDEIKNIWPLLDTKTNKIANGLIKFCLATGGQRHGEVLRCDRSCYDFRKMELVIPASINKNGHDHVVPLTSLALNILNEMEKIVGDSKFFFPAINKEDEPYSITSFSTALKRFCETNEYKQLKSDSNQLMLERFVPRDIRRTVETRMSEIGIPKEIRDRVQDHNLKRDVTDKHYNRYDYLKEKREALKTWESKLKDIMACEEEHNNMQ